MVFRYAWLQFCVLYAPTPWSKQEIFYWYEEPASLSIASTEKMTREEVENKEKWEREKENTQTNKWHNTFVNENEIRMHKNTQLVKWLKFIDCSAHACMYVYARSKAFFGMNA